MINYCLLLDILVQNKDEKYNTFNSKITKSNVRSLGCTMPFLRHVSNQYKDNLDDIVALPVHDYYEVDMLKGIVISQSKLPFCQKKQYLSDFVVTLENWSVCDSCVIKVPANERNLYFDYFVTLCQDSKAFVCRYGVVNLLSNFLIVDYIDSVLGVLSEISAWGSYYVDMAVAWLIATAMIKFSEKTKFYMLNEGRVSLNKFSYNVALQKMRDSYQISKADKEWTKTVKR